MDNPTPVLGTTYQGILGAVINTLRCDEKKKITQAEIAKQLGITVSTWSRIERGESPITLEQLLGVAEFLNLPLSELFKFVEGRVLELNNSGVKVAISKEALNEGKLLPLSTGQLIAMAAFPGSVGLMGVAAYGIYKALVRVAKK